jgi:hypothetical protein
MQPSAGNRGWETRPPAMIQVRIRPVIRHEAILGIVTKFLISLGGSAWAGFGVENRFPPFRKML